MTPSIVEGLGRLEETRRDTPGNEKPKPADAEKEKEEEGIKDDEPSLEQPGVGKPISHGQIVELWKQLRSHDDEVGDRGLKFTLENLLKGSRVYVPPPPPKPEPTPEYKALMARLRREKEERQYQRMINPPPPTETFSQRFPSGGASSMAYGFAEVNRAKASDLGDDEVTYNDIHRQFMLVLNFLVTIFGSAATLWILARWWSTPARLFLTMGGALVIAIAEVGVYSAYVWHLSEAKQKDTKTKEVKEVVKTWVVGGDDDDQSATGAFKEADMINIDSKASAHEENGVRKRKKEPS